MLTLVAVMTAAGSAGADVQEKLLERLGKAVEEDAGGYESVGQAVIRHLEKKSSTKVDVSVESGWCYRFLAVGEKDAFKIKVKVSKGEEVVGATGGSYPVAFVDTCPSAGATLGVTVENESFGGDLIIATYRIKTSKSPGKNELGGRLKMLADKHVPGGKLVAPPSTGILAKGKSFVMSASVKAGTCYKLLAVGGTGVTDIGIEVRVGSQVVAEDESSGDHPIVEHCPGSGGKMEAKIYVVDGAGPVLAGAFESPASTILVGAADPASALDMRLESEASIYAGDLTMMGIIKKGEIVNKKPIDYDMTLSKGVCYKLIAVGGSGVSDLDIALHKPKVKGKKGLLAEDTTSDDAPIASYCADFSGPATVTITSKGSGLYSYAVYAGASEEAGAMGVFGELNAALEEAAKGLGAGLKAADTIKTAVVGGDTVGDFDLKMVKGYCYTLLVVGIGDVKDLDVTVLGENMKLASDAKPGQQLVVELCPEKDVVATTKVTSHGGFGPVAFKPFRSETEVDQVFIPVGGLGSSYVAKAIRKVHAKEGKQRPAVSEFMQGSLTTAKATTFDVELKGELCYTIIAVGVPSVKDLEVVFFSPLGDEVARAPASGKEIVVHTDPCPKWSGTYQVQVKMYNGYGAFGVQVFGK